METPSKIFEKSLAWLQANYHNFRFFVERDIVWTVQVQLQKLTEESTSQYEAFNDYPILKGRRRGISSDLAILDRQNHVEVAVEFKYEPSHKRTDIPKNKFPVIGWKDVEKDIRRIKGFVNQRKAKAAYALLIDEGGYFRKRQPYPGSRWLNWGNGVWLLYSRVWAGSRFL